MDYEIDNKHHRPPECGDELCKRIIIQEADVSVPIEIMPTARVRRIQAECLGEPEITNERSNSICRIVITQTIGVRIPIEYNVSTRVGDSEVTCRELRAMD